MKKQKIYLSDFSMHMLIIGCVIASLLFLISAILPLIPWNNTFELFESIFFSDMLAGLTFRVMVMSTLIAFVCDYLIKAKRQKSEG